MIYETRERSDGDCEVWRYILGDKLPAQHIATFHKVDASPRFAKTNAEHFAEEQNHREEALEEFVDKYTGSPYR